MAPAAPDTSRATRVFRAALNSLLGVPTAAEGQKGLFGRCSTYVVRTAAENAEQVRVDAVAAEEADEEERKRREAERKRKEEAERREQERLAALRERQDEIRAMERSMKGLFNAGNWAECAAAAAALSHETSNEEAFDDRIWAVQQSYAAACQALQGEHVAAKKAVCDAGGRAEFLKQLRWMATDAPLQAKDKAECCLLLVHALQAGARQANREDVRALVEKALLEDPSHRAAWVWRAEIRQEDIGGLLATGDTC